MTKKIGYRILANTVGILLAQTTFAHHSAAMFDSQKELALAGTVKEFQWTNPHCFIQVLVPGNTGVEEWSVEMNTPREIFRFGWRPTTLKPGDKVTLLVHPERGGKKAGGFVSARGADGQWIGTQPQGQQP